MTKTKIDCRNNLWASQYLGTFDNDSTIYNKVAPLNRLFQLICEERGLRPEDVDFENFDSLRAPDGQCLMTLPIPESFILRLQAERYRQGDTERTRYYDFLHLRQYFQFIVDQGALSKNPYANLSSPKLLEKMKPRHLRLDEANALLATAAHINIVTFTLIYFLLATGARPGETAQMHVSYIKTWVHVIGKSGHRERPIVSGLRETLRDYLRSSYYKRMSEKNPSGLLFFSRSGDGSPLKKGEINKILRGVAALAKVRTDITAYWMRHSFATFLYNNGVSLPVLQQLMDHDRETSTRHYVPKETTPEVRAIIDNSPLAQLVMRANKEIVHRLSSQVEKS